MAVDCYPFNLGGVDLILGVAWLETLGDVRANWKKMTMAFDLLGENRILQGNPALSFSQASLKSIIHTQDVAVCIILWAMETSDTTRGGVDEHQK